MCSSMSRREKECVGTGTMCGKNFETPFSLRRGILQTPWIDTSYPLMTFKTHRVILVIYTNEITLPPDPSPSSFSSSL